MKNLLSNHMRFIVCIFALFLSFNRVFSSGIVVLLNGPTCVGKTSIAKKMCEILSKNSNAKWKHVNTDEYFGQLFDSNGDNVIKI